MNKVFKKIYSGRRICPICKKAESKIFLPEKIDQNLISNFSFASRKNPEYMRHELVRCVYCSLIYTNKPLKKSIIEKLYFNADFNSSLYADQASNAYINGLLLIIKKLNIKSEILDVGCGEGSFIYKLFKLGFNNVTGIEPSLLAIKHANEKIKKKIKPGFFSKKLIGNKKYDLITFFMTLEHVLEPKDILKNFNEVLKKDGTLALVVHDSSSLLNKILGSKSPIIDIEHLQLFNKKSIYKILDKAGFNNIQIKPLKNLYSLDYLLLLLPIPNFFKKIIIRFLKIFAIDKIIIPLKLGNIIITARK